MSIEQFIFTWKKDSYQRIECVNRDQNGNPLHIRFWRKDKLILDLYVNYDADGNWQNIYSEIPKEGK